jgi:hypothetical protein
MDRQQINTILTLAIEQLLASDLVLLALQVNERSITHHLARYLLDEIVKVDAELNVDVEYNRHHDDVKRLDLPRGSIETDDTEATTVFPDVIVHRRNTDDTNILVLEIKKSGRRIDFDRRKLLAFRNQLGYQHAAHVILGIDRWGNAISNVIWIDGDA